MRKRFQNGSLKKSPDGKRWIASYRDDNDSGGRTQHAKSIGKVSKMTRLEALNKLAELVRPVNERLSFVASQSTTVKEFVDKVYFPFYKRKWKRITFQARKSSVTFHIVGHFGARKLNAISRNEMQKFLDDRKKLSRGMVDHLRWDLKQIFDLAVAEGVLPRNPGYVNGSMLLFVPKECLAPVRPILTIDQVKAMFSALDLRERCIVKLGLIGGMRCSEIFGLRRGSVLADQVGIIERVCKRDVDTPKTPNSTRQVALAIGLRQELERWLADSPNTGEAGWLFPSERLTTPMDADNVMERYIKPKLKPLKLDWVDFRVLRRTHSTLMNDLEVNPKVVADNQGHTVDVNLNVYSKSSMESRLEAVQILESAFVN